MRLRILLEETQYDIRIPERSIQLKAEGKLRTQEIILVDDGRRELDLPVANEVAPEPHINVQQRARPYDDGLQKSAVEPRGEECVDEEAVR